MIYFKRINNKYIKQLNEHVIQPQPSATNTISTLKISKKEQIDLISVKSYGAGNEGSFFEVAYKNADQLLAWDLDNSYINNINIPSKGSYTV